MKFILHNITKEPLVFSELTVSYYKDILKCVFGNTPSFESFTETIYDVLFALGTKEKNFYKTLTIYEIFQILTEIRIQTFGEECIVSVTKNEVKGNLHLDLQKMLEDLKGTITSFEDSFFEHDNIKVTFGFPILGRCISDVEEQEIVYVKSITIKNKTLSFQDNNTAKNILDNLPAKFNLSVHAHCKDFFNKALEINLLQRYNLEEQKLFFIPTLENLIWYTKLYFSEPLDVFYDNLFFLAHHGKIDLNYIEKCTPGEYIFLAKKLAATIKERNANLSEDELQH